MNKKIILLAIALMLFAGVVSASSINGDYQGNPIVTVTSNGKLLETDEVPGMILDGHTVVPISLLRQLGASVTWDAYAYNVEVKMPQSQNDNSVKFANDVEMYRYIYFINEQAALVAQIMSAINLSSNSQNDRKMAIDQVNRLRNDVNDDWVKGFSTMQAYSGDINQITEIKVCLDNIKQYLLKFDTSSAFSEWSLMKNDINNLYSKYDQIVQKETSDTFNKAISDLNAQPEVQQPQLQVPEIQPTKNTNSNQNYTINDAVLELGFISSANITVDARSLAIELVEIRKTKKQSDYSIQDALVDLGIPQGARPTLATLRQAVKLISIH